LDSRVKALKVVFGDAVSGAVVSELASRFSPRVVSDGVFLDHFFNLLCLFGGKLRLSTRCLNVATVSFLVLLYSKPPKVAFVYLDVGLDVDRRRYEARVLTPRGEYRFAGDGLTDLLGPKVSFTSKKLPSVLAGDYVPVSGEYLVIDTRLDGYEPVFVVEGTRKWFVYESSTSPVAANVLFLLSLLS